MVLGTAYCEDAEVIEMKEQPILFSGPMVRAVLAGRKSQTRRVIKSPFEIQSNGYRSRLFRRQGNERFCPYPCPYGKPGDRLWVREKHQAVHFSHDYESGYCDEWYQADKFPKEPSNFHPIVYAADWEKDHREGYSESVEDRGFKWRPSIFMPRWASRILLEVVNVRVERLTEISDHAASCEGVEPCEEFDCFIPSFAALWESINGPGSWEANPWVWVVEFKKVEEKV